MDDLPIDPPDRERNRFMNFMQLLKDSGLINPESDYDDVIRLLDEFLDSEDED